jgi:negative regulator of sigma E activity
MRKLDLIQEHLEAKHYLDMATSDVRFSYVLHTYTQIKKNGLTTLELMHNAHFNYCSEELTQISFSAFQRSVYRSAEKIEELDDFLELCEMIIKQIKGV